MIHSEQESSILRPELLPLFTRSKGSEKNRLFGTDAQLVMYDSLSRLFENTTIQVHQSPLNSQLDFEGKDIILTYPDETHTYIDVAATAWVANQKLDTKGAFLKYDSILLLPVLDYHYKFIPDSILLDTISEWKKNHDDAHYLIWKYIQNCTSAEAAIPYVVPQNDFLAQLKIEHKLYRSHRNR